MFRRVEAVLAFTLVELLLIISIIAVLIAMLLPALKSARDQARRTACAIHQRQIVIASEAYAHDYDTLPIMNRQGLDINYRKIPALDKYVRQEVRGFGPETWEVYLHAKNFWYGAGFRGILFQVDISSHMSETDFGKWRNFGLLWKERSIGNPRGFFCPSQRHRYYRWNTPWNPWPPSLSTARLPDKPRYANHTESSFERRMGLTGVPWDRVSPRTVLYTDRLLDDDDNPEIVKNTHRVGVNAAYRDGHVTFIRDDRLLTWRWDTKQDILEIYDWLDRQFNR